MDWPRTRRPWVDPALPLTEMGKDDEKMRLEKGSSYTDLLFGR